MIVVSVPKHELQGAGRIASSLTLLDIRLRSVNVTEEGIDAFFDDKDTTVPNVNVEYRSGMKEFVEGKVLTTFVGANVTLSKGNAKVVYTVEYLATYGLPASAVPADIKPEMFEYFANHNGLLNCWPYVRGLISSLSSDVGLPITLPLLRIQAKPEEAKADLKPTEQQ